MNTKIAKYGVTPVERPKIRATKTLDLRNELGKERIQKHSRNWLTCDGANPISIALRTPKNTVKYI